MVEISYIQLKWLNIIAAAMRYKIVLIGDIVGSQKLNEADRSRLQEDLSDLIKKINARSETIEAPLTITLGDEFQCVYSGAESILSDTWTILAGIHPVRVRFSIGIGKIVTPINRKQSLGMDGPAFYAARHGIEKLKQTNKIYRIEIAGESGTEPDMPELSLMNHTLEFLSNEMKRWKKVRFQILERVNRDVAIKDIARELELSEAAVYKNRDEGDLNLVLGLQETISRLLHLKLKVY